MEKARSLIKKLRLKKHPREGGFFRETYRSKELRRNRNLSTAIYYLFTRGSISLMHRLKSDEIFHFYCGDPVEMLLISPHGRSKVVVLGNDVLKGMQPQVLVPRNFWQGSKLKKGGHYALVGTTMAPGFDYKDYEHGNRAKLIKRYPGLKKLIVALTSG